MVLLVEYSTLDFGLGQDMLVPEIEPSVGDPCRVWSLPLSSSLFALALLARAHALSQKQSKQTESF